MLSMHSSMQMVGRMTSFFLPRDGAAGMEDIVFLGGMLINCGHLISVPCLSSISPEVSTEERRI